MFGHRKLLIIIVLLSVWTKSTNSITCYTDAVCFDDSNFNECTQTGGFYDTSDITCTQRGFNVGTCCAPDYAICRQLSAGACVLYFATGATWRDTEEGEECTCPEFKSCCVDGTCHDEMEEVDCTAAGGTFNNVGCRTNPCVATGACCDAGSGFCADVPDGHCDLTINTFLGEGTTCKNDCSAGYYSGTGRCCTSTCSEVSDESKCPATVESGVFMDGLSCSADWSADCTGSCLVDDKCLRTLPYECIVLQGRWFAGGRCIPDPTDACVFGNTCIDNVPINYCNTLVDGVGTPSGTCEGYSTGPPGSCCYNGKCTYYSQNGELLCNGSPNDGFHADATCDTGVCFDASIGKCCLLGMICFRLNETECETYSQIYIESGDIFPYTWAPSNDTYCLEGCGGETLIINTTIRLFAPAVVSKAQISFVRSDFIFAQNFIGDEISLDAELSSISFDKNFTLTKSTLKITNSVLVVGNCLKISSGSNLIVDLENAEAGADQQILSYACSEGEFDSIEINTGNDCLVSSEIQSTLFGLFFSLEDSCTKSSTSSTSSSGSVDSTVTSSGSSTSSDPDLIETFEETSEHSSAISFILSVYLYYCFFVL